MYPNKATNPPISDRWSFLWLVIGAILVAFTYGMYRNPLAGCLALVFLLRFFRGRKVGVGFLLTYFTISIVSIPAWWEAGFSYTLPTPFRIVFGFIVGLMYTIPLLLDRILVRRFRGFAATLVFPLAITAFEFVSIWPNPISAYGSLANSQFGSVYLTQLMSITGMWGVTFLVSWFASTVNWIWEEGAAWQRIRKGAAIFAGLMFVVLLYGVIRLTYVLPQPGTVPIHAVVETDYTAYEWDSKIAALNVTDPAAFRAITQPTFERYMQATIREARAGAKIVVWPELAAEGYREDVNALVEQGKDVAKQEGIYLAMGLGVVSSDPEQGYLDENKLVIVDPNGNIVVDQLKYGCMALTMYDFEIQTVNTPYGKLAGVICCDLEYPYVVRQASQKGVDILLVPAFEPTRANLIAHPQMAPFRAIENGISIFRSTAQGFSQAIDPYGRVIGTMNHTTASDAVLVAQVPNRHVVTIYSLVGELFGWLTLVSFMAMLGWAIFRGRKTSVGAVGTMER